MRPVLAAAVAALTLGLALILARRYRANAWVTPYALTSRPVEENATEGQRLGLEPVQAGPLRGLLRRPTSGHAWFLYWGGNTSTYFKEAVDTVAGLQLPAEVGVLILAPPGFDSPGHPSPEGLERDAPLAREWLRTSEGAEHLVAGGFSMGCYSALWAAGAHVEAVVLLGVARVFETGDAGPLLRLGQPVRYVLPSRPPRVPALVIQAQFNEPAREAEPSEGALVAAWLEARLVTVPGITHAQTPLHPQAQREARTFILAALGLAAH